MTTLRSVLAVAVLCSVVVLAPALSAAEPGKSVSCNERGVTGVVTLHTLSGVERYRCELPSSPSSVAADDVWRMVPEGLQASLRERVELERQHLRVPALPPLLTDFNLSINVLCSVTGVGVLLMVPPFLPVTPLLFSTFTLLYTNGTLGEWLRFSTFSFLSPFVGISLYVPNGVFAYVGYAGLVVATTG